jgi:hypothetical protein
MLRSRNSGGRLVRSTPRQNTRSAPRPRSMRAGGALKSTPRKFQFGTGRRGVSYGPPGGALSPFGTQGKIVDMNPQGGCTSDNQCDSGCTSDELPACLSNGVCYCHTMGDDWPE